MSERDVMKLLSEANPVSIEALTDAPGDPESIGVFRRKTRRGLVLAAAVVAVALTVSLLGVFVVNASNSPRPRGSVGFEGDSGIPLPTVAYPLVPGAKQVSIADASAALHGPIVLPETSLVDPSDAGPVWIAGRAPNVTAAVTFPVQGVFIDYIVPPPARDPSATYEAIARETPQSFKAIDFNGGTALAVKQNSDQTGHNFGGVIFVLNGAEIRVFGHYDEQTLQSIAQSIVDRSGP